MRQQAEKSENITEVRNLVNNIFEIHTIHSQQIKAKIKGKDFTDVHGLDFNVWAYDTEYDIEKVYYSIKDKYHSLHWDKYGYNAY